MVCQLTTVLASQHPSDFSLPTLSSILWLWLPMHPTRQPLVPLLLTTDPSSQTLAISGETAVHGDLFRKYWADALLRRRGTSSFIASPHHISLHPPTLHHGPFATTVSAPFPSLFRSNPAACFEITAKTRSQDRVSSESRFPCCHPSTHYSPLPPIPPHVYRIIITTPPTLTLLLASKRPFNSDLIDHSARRPRLVPCVILPHGLTGLALRRPLWRKPHHCLDERVVVITITVTITSIVCTYVCLCKNSESDHQRVYCANEIGHPHILNDGHHLITSSFTYHPADRSSHPATSMRRVVTITLRHSTRPVRRVAA